MQRIALAIPPLLALWTISWPTASAYEPAATAKQPAEKQAEKNAAKPGGKDSQAVERPPGSFWRVRQAALSNRR